jgi:hypothetical protein
MTLHEEILVRVRRTERVVQLLTKALCGTRQKTVNSENWSEDEKNEMTDFINTKLVDYSDYSL